MFGIAPWSAGEALQIAEELALHGLKATGALPYYYASSDFLVCGQRRKADDMFNAYKELSIRIGQEQTFMASIGIDAFQALLGGKLVESVDLLDRIISISQESDVQGTAYNNVILYGLRLVIYLGITSEYSDRSLWKLVPENMNSRIFRYVPLYKAYQGLIDEVNEMLERMLERRPNITTREDLTHAWLDVAYLESAVIAGHRRATELLLDRFKDNTLATTGNYWSTCVARHLGAAAALLERYDEAREYYKEAIRVCTEMKFRPELALTRLQLAELILDQYPDEKKEALEHLDFAINEFREMKMQPSLERALRRKDILKA